MIPCNSNYGGFRTRYFSQIFETFDLFKEEYNNCPIEHILEETNLQTLYYLLYARYGNSNISYSDENQFKYALFGTIFKYGPSWEKRLDLQKKFRALTNDEIMAGTKAIHNHSFNPGTAPTTQSLEELLTLNDQNTTNYKKSLVEGYALQYSLLETDVTEDFIDKFAPLFIKFLAPDYPLLYSTKGELDYE